MMGAGADRNWKSIEMERTGVMAALQQIQTRKGFLPREELESLAARFRLPVMQLYSLATFYTAFHLEPRGRHCIKVCMGTACHVQGAPLVMEALEQRTGAKAGGTSPDLAYSLEAVRCVGACSMAPVVVIDQDTHGRVRQRDLKRVLKRYTQR